MALPSVEYVRRDPGGSVLQQIVRDHFETFRVEAAHVRDGEGLPRFVEEEYDNAVMESWFSTVKSEEGERFESFARAKEALFDYIEVFYNQRRRHSTLGQISPAEFERRAAYAA